MKQVIKHRDGGLLNMIRRTDPDDKTEIQKVVKTGVSGSPIKNGKSVRAESQVRKWNKKADKNIYKSEITHQEPEGNGARKRILEYEKKRANELREELQTEDKHKRP